MNSAALPLCGCRFQTRGLFSLAQLNGIVCYNSWVTFGVEPLQAMPNRIRSYFGIVRMAGPNGKPDVKRGVMEFVTRRFGPDIGLRVNKRSGALHATAYDEADAILAGLYGHCVHHTRACVSDTSVVAQALPLVLTPSVGVGQETWEAWARQCGLVGEDVLGREVTADDAAVSDGDVVLAKGKGGKGSAPKKSVKGSGKGGAEPTVAVACVGLSEEGRERVAWGVKKVCEALGEGVRRRACGQEGDLGAVAEEEDVGDKNESN